MTDLTAYARSLADALPPLSDSECEQAARILATVELSDAA